MQDSVKKLNATRLAGYILIVVAAVSVGVALYLSLRANELLKYEEEWVKALLQAGLIAVLGVVTSGVLETFKDSLQKRRDQSKIRFEILEGIGRTYMDVKLIRRKAQDTQKMDPDDLQELNELQVRLELYKYNCGNLFEDSVGFEDSLSTMEKYLNRVANKPSSEERRKFTDREGFRKFSNAFHKANIIMQRDIAGS